MTRAPLFMGIDGGGSKLRIAIANSELETRSSQTFGGANPNIIGQEAARAKVQRGISKLMQRAGLQREDITAVAIGIAGASNLHSEPWLVETVKPVLPASFLLPSSDLEIALAGALAQRRGILLLAGTGSAAYGRAPSGERLQIGGWGYLLGDEGSSYWIGIQLLKHIVNEYDSGAGPRLTNLSKACLNALGLSQARDLVAWVYRSERAPVERVAGLAPYVLQGADAGEAQALRILRCAADHLVSQVETLRRRLSYERAPIAFAGGLLDNANALSEEVARRLALPERPTAKYPPVTGAALLAKLEWSAKNRS
ncbi:MAG: hypothetical protein OXG85_13640 [Chloroflexi bacterium]|nr:hypothetical protein [Chloroflexota bacterium]